MFEKFNIKLLWLLMFSLGIGICFFVDNVEAESNSWKGEIYPSSNFGGVPVEVPSIEEINFDWGNTESPATGIKPNTAFSARYEKSLYTDQGGHNLIVIANGGIRVYVDGKLEIDEWNDSGVDEHYEKPLYLTKGQHDIRIEFNETRGEANIKFSLDNLLRDNRWYGVVFPSNNLTGNGSLVGYSPQIHDLNFDWGDVKSPADGIRPNTTFSAVYQRNVTVEEGAHNIISLANGGMRVYIDGELQIDNWNDDGTTQHIEKPVYLSKGKHTIRVEFKETAGKANIQFVLDNLLRDNRWYGVVFPSDDLSGKGTLVGYDPQIQNLDFDWGNDKSPAPGIRPNTTFSAVYQRNVTVDEGGHNVISVANGGTRVYIDGELEIDNWNDDGTSQHKEKPVYLSKGKHTIRVEFKETAGEANLKFVLDNLLRDNRWYGVVFPTNDLSGKGTLVGYDPHIPNLNFDWGDTKSPAPGIPPNRTFSAVYQRNIDVEQGGYNLLTLANGGVRIYVDGKLEIDKWNDTGNTQHYEQPVYLSQGKHSIRVEFKETAGEANLEFVLDNLLRDNRWYGVVFPSSDLSGTGTLVGYDPQIPNLNFDWGDTKSPAPGMRPNTTFSAVYQRKLQVDGGEHNLIALVNGGVRIYVDNQLEIDKWNDTGGLQTHSKLLNLKKGSHTIRVEFNETAGKANIDFSLTKENQSNGIEKSYTTTTYNYSFSYMVDMQMAQGSPKSDGTGQTPASRSEVEYYANPSSFSKDSPEYYQFLNLSENTGIDVNEVNNKVLNNAGTLKGTAQAFVDAGEKYNVNEVYLIAHALHETGYGTSTLAKGVKINGKTVYNMYGTAAYDGSADSSGAQYAYDKGWFTPEAAIIGGAEFIAKNYIARGQNTLYKMKWNPDNPATHQYATHVQWPIGQTSKMDNIYKLLNNYSLIFDVPSFKNQPDGSLISYPDNIVGYTTTRVNFRSQPNSSRDDVIISVLDDNTKVTVLGYNGGNWYNVKAGNTEGWVHADYLDVKNLLEVTATSLNVRTDPSTTGSPVGGLSQGTLIAGVTDSNGNLVRSNEWYKIHYGDTTRWVSGGTNGEYISER